MANRQHGRPGRPAGGRSARTVSVSRSSGRDVAAPGTPIYTEPEVRRWPHPLEDGGSSPVPEPAMHYIRCALSYQNQLLADIKVLLEQLAAAPPAAEKPADPEKDGENLSKL
ncbi:hypothetical protein [Oscillibacter sp.]|uniref:hypothetical protein n=1 Tax=Oscillibacter sp. TaxID=1945593 RepID=UPI002D7EA8BD|nr:hypothetical protein [Oscillibacter sp.]